MKTEKKYYADKNQRPGWFDYPAEVKAIVDQGLVEFAPWHMADAEFSLATYQLLKARYNRELFPVAHRYGTDTVACFEKNGGGKVLLINGHTGVGHEQEGAFDSFWGWFRFAIDELVELNS